MCKLIQRYLKFCSHFFDFVEALEVGEEASDSELRKVGEVGLYLIWHGEPMSNG